MSSILYILITIVFVSIVLSIVMAIIGLNKRLNKDLLTKTNESLKLQTKIERGENLETALQELRSQISELKSDITIMKDKAQLNELKMSSDLIKVLLENQRRVLPFKYSQVYYELMSKRLSSSSLSKKLADLNSRLKRIADLSEPMHLNYENDPYTINSMKPIPKEQFKKIFSNEITNN